MNKIKLHLGCGKRYLPDYCNIDLAKYKHINDKQDIRKLIGFENSSVDLIYASHVIDYFDREEIVSMFKRWRKLLKKGGILRVAVPDFVALVKVYELTRDTSRVSGPLLGVWKIRGRDKTIYHKAIYDCNSLRSVFTKAGFFKIRRWDWRAEFKDYPKYDDYSQAYYPHMDKENGILISLNMEAMK